MPITPARVAWYVTGRFYEDEKKQIQDLGYFLYVGGISGALFNSNTLGESTAVLTFRSAPFTAQPVTNGDISIGLDTVGDFSIYRFPTASRSGVSRARTRSPRSVPTSGSWRSPARPSRPAEPGNDPFRLAPMESSGCGPAATATQ